MTAPERLPATVARLTTELEAERALADDLANGAVDLYRNGNATDLDAALARWREARGR